MVVLAVGQPVELVVADYARIEELTSERFARDARAAELALAAEASFRSAPEGRTSVAVVLATGDTALPPVLQLRLQHVARSEADRQIVLYRDADVYRGVFELAAGRYDVEISPIDASWRLAGSLDAVPASLHLRAEPGGRR
jgi:hypothetical protein